MNGVTTEATRAMPLTPPMITSASRAASPRPEASGETPKALPRADDTPLAWTVGSRAPLAMMTW